MISVWCWSVRPVRRYCFKAAQAMVPTQAILPIQSVTREQPSCRKAGLSQPEHLNLRDITPVMIFLLPDPEQIMDIPDLPAAEHLRLPRFSPGQIRMEIGNCLSEILPPATPAASAAAGLWKLPPAAELRRFLIIVSIISVTAFQTGQYFTPAREDSFGILPETTTQPLLTEEYF